MSDKPLSQTVTVKHEQGLHARPAEMLARTAMGFQSRVDLVVNGQRVDAKSILNILTLGATAGSMVEVEAEGPDAEQALKALAGLIESNFDQESAQPKGGASQTGAIG